MTGVFREKCSVNILDSVCNILDSVCPTMVGVIIVVSVKLMLYICESGSRGW